MNSKIKSSEEIDLIKEKIPEDGINLKQLIEELGTNGIFLLTIILTAPFIIPASIPGSSLPFGILIILLQLSSLKNNKPYLPKKIVEYKISKEHMETIFNALEKFMKFIERFIKPRGKFMSSHKNIQQINCIMIMCLAFLLLLPLPIPFTDFLPATGILLLTFGSMEKDGLLVILGYLMFFVSVIYMLSFSYAGWIGIKLILAKFNI